jgi:signal peptidase I
VTERPDSNSGTEAEPEAASQGPAPRADQTRPADQAPPAGEAAADETAAQSSPTAVSDDAEHSDGEDEEHDEPSGQKKQRPLSHELPVLLVIAVALALLLKAFVVQAFYIPSGSMEQTLLIKDRVLVNKLVYRFRDVHRGEIVVFNGGGTGFTKSESVIPPPRNNFERATRWVQRAIGAGAPGERDFVKRVIAVGGDTVACCDAQGRVTVNGVPLDEPYIYENSENVEGARKFAPVKVPQGDLWVMGDHRGDSNDSRFSGPIPQDHVIGRAFVRVWPISRFGFLRVPATFSKTHSAAPAALGVVGIPALVLIRRRRRR